MHRGTKKQEINHNYKIYCRLRPIEVDQQMITIKDDQNLQITDPVGSEQNRSQSKKSVKADENAFKFDHIFQGQANQKDIYEKLGQASVNKLVDGINSCIIAYGQTSAGKSYTIFGEDSKFSLDAMSASNRDRKGIAIKIADSILTSAHELQHKKDVFLTCSMAEIYLDQVRDLGKGCSEYLQKQYNKSAGSIHSSQKISSTQSHKLEHSNQVLQNYEKENLTIYENSEGKVVIKDLVQIEIKKMEDVYQFIQSCFQLRERLEMQGHNIWNRAHTIFQINMQQHDKEDDCLPCINSTIQLVDLAGSERIAKSLAEGLKFQESILINKTLQTLNNCLIEVARHGKHIPYRDSKLTKVMQNCMHPSSFISLIIVIKPFESNYDEALSTLQYADRTTFTEVNQDPQQIGTLNSPASQGTTVVGFNEAQLQNLKNENAGYKAQLTRLQKDMKNKFENLCHIIGYDGDLEQLAAMKDRMRLQEDKQMFKLQKEAVQKIEFMRQDNIDLQKKVTSLSGKLDVQKFDYIQKHQKQHQIEVDLHNKIARMNERIQALGLTNDEILKKINKEREWEINKLKDDQVVMLEHNADIIFKLPAMFTKRNEQTLKEQA